MMRRDEVQAQADAFCAWHAKAGRPWDEDFALWTRSKMLGAADRTRIRTAVVERLTSTTAAFTMLDASA